MCLRNDIGSKSAFFISQIALLIHFLLFLPARLAPHFHADLMDGVRGFFLGVAIGTLILSAGRSRRHLA
jgi:hypothetical protein